LPDPLRTAVSCFFFKKERSFPFTELSPPSVGTSEPESGAFPLHQCPKQDEEVNKRKEEGTRTWITPCHDPEKRGEMEEGRASGGGRGEPMVWSFVVLFFFFFFFFIFFFLFFFFFFFLFGFFFCFFTFFFCFFLSLPFLGRCSFGRSLGGSPPVKASLPFAHVFVSL